MSSLRAYDIVVIHGLVGAPQHNFAPATVLDQDAPAPGRVPIQLLHGSRAKLSVRRSNLLDMWGEEERAMLLTLIVWERQLELRVARQFLLDRLRGEEGLCLEVASHFPPRETMGLTTGFSRGQLVREWSAVALEGGRFVWRPLNGEGRERVFGADAIPDGIERIDCAVVGIGSARFVVAGGCADHPSRARCFFASAFLYDAITHAVEPLPDMPGPRHGCGGAHIDGRVYVMGGNYVDRRGGEMCVWLDVGSWVRGAAAPVGWQRLGASLPARGLEPHGHIAFVPVAAVGGRLVVITNRIAWAFNPALEDDTPSAAPSERRKRWRAVRTPGSSGPARSRGRCDRCPAELGASAHGCVEWGQHMIVSSGRGAGDLYAHEVSPPCHVYAFRFLWPAEPADGATPAAAPWPHPTQVRCAAPWAVGEWTRLGKVCDTNRVGADLVVVHGRLYISGGTHEGPRTHFDGSVACWGGRYADLLAAPPATGTAEADTANAVDGGGGGSDDDDSDDDDGGGDGDGGGGEGVPEGVPEEGGEEEACAHEVAHLCVDGRAVVPSGIRDCSRRWTVVDDLNLPTAMHAHSAITIPLMPR